ncbi:lipid droplet phospholipase 1 isoform X3, partial [Fagus crenata]
TNNSWRGLKAQAMGTTTTTQGNAASSKGIVNAKNEPDHLLVLVHGIMARYMLIKDYAQNST